MSPSRRFICLFGLFLAARANPSPNRASLCDLTHTHFPGKVAFPIVPKRELTPSCVFRPNSTQDVAGFVKLAAANDPCKKHCSVSNPLFAVRSGGHTIWKGAANTDGGVTVDMRGFDSFSLSSDKKVASIGAGSVFANVYPQLVPHNLTVLGGRVPGPAAGGFLSGGGKNFLSRRHGFGCDNIYGYEIVLADGTVTYASAGHNQDLWLALKGGSNNFGIITRYDLATYPLSLMWGGTVSLNFTPEVLEAEAQLFSDLMRPENFDDAADFGILLGFADGAFSIDNTMYYSEAVANPPLFANFTRLPDITATSLALTTVADVVIADGALVPVQIPRGFELVYAFHNSDSTIYSQIIKTWQKGIAMIQNLAGLEIHFLIQPMPVTNGTNSLGLPIHDTDLVMGLLTAYWDNVRDDNTAIGAIQSIVRQHETILQKQDLLNDYKYLNYADVSQDPISSYGKRNIARLWAASKKYDPKGFWQTRVPGYKLPVSY
ncbi:hypothetical protein F5B18DRAFT_665207 [Nemania serpens]|nr:hypothetical protein F5B18DRAFT_665207 [Nemania serpens]